MKKLVLLILAVACINLGRGATKSSISQFGITWTFDKAYEAGQFVNGDWWVVGPVKITSISKPSNMAQRDGSMINPTPSTAQGYDGRVGGYNASLDVSTQCPNLIVNTNSSLISTIARVPTELDRAKRRPALEVGAVLTVLASAPPANSFRPAYAGSQKTIYSADNLRTDLLLSLNPPPTTPALTEVEAMFEKPWLDHVLEWQGDDLHPRLNLPNYGGGIARNSGTGGLSLLLNYTVAQKQALLHRFIQVGIDHYGLVKNGANWGNVGGTIGPGRKMQILFAGLMLGKTEMINIAKSVNTRAVFQEDGQTFYLTQAEKDATRHPDNCSGSADYCHPGYYDSLPLGTPCWGERHYKWESTGYNYLPGKVGYKAITHKSTVGLCLVARLLGLKDAWAHDAYFDWMDRATTLGLTSGWGSYFMDFMWTWYRDYQVGITNAEFGIRSAECPALPNPLNKEAINDLRLTINGLRFFNMTGKSVLFQQQIKPGVIYIEYNNQVSKLVVVE